MIVVLLAYQSSSPTNPSHTNPAVQKFKVTGKWALKTADNAFMKQHQVALAENSPCEQKLKTTKIKKHNT